MEKLDISDIKGVKELTFDETVECTGGESLLYWIAYGVGTAGRAVKNAMLEHAETVMASGGAASTLAYK